MKKKALLLVTFLLCLYLIPLMSSVEYAANEQSITSFAETLPDDVLYYADELDYNMSTMLIDGNVTGGSETNDYTYMIADDASNWRGSSSGSALYLYFDIARVGNVNNITVFYDALSSSAGSDYIALYLSNPLGSDLLIDEDTDVASDAVITGNTTIENIQDYIYGDIYTFYFYTTYKAPSTIIDADWFDIRTITLVEDGYAEPFNDVSDIVFQSSMGLAGGEYGISTDGDVGDIWITCDDVGSEYVMYEYVLDTALSIENYMEFRFKTDTGVMMHVQIVDSSAATYWVVLSGISPTFITSKYYLGACGLDDIKKIRLRTDDVPNTIDTGTLHIYWEYLRISPADEMGWQHDCSTTEGISSSDGGTITSDGDEVTLTSDVDGSSFIIPTDTTTTVAAISCTYYPFLSLNCTGISEGDGWKLEQYDGSAWATLQATYVTSTGIYHYNMRALDTYVSQFRVNLTQTAVIKFSFMKACSIANWTYAGTGVSVDDVLYVSDGTLYCSANSITSMILDHDPALSVSTSFGDLWSITTTSGTPQIDYYVDGSWIGYSSETEGIFANGTLTDVRIKFTASANIAAITFLYIPPQWYLISTAQLWFIMPTWYIVVTAILKFVTPLDETALNWFLVFLGLFMIPASTLYLVKGGRDNMSMNKAFFFIIAFILGWALVIGGIFA